MTPLYGHDSESTAYLVADYPYGRKVRCRIRYWIESDARKGFRFVSQTENPKTLRWNAPKKSTYSLIAECLFLDEIGHVKASAITEYSDAASCSTFARYFPGADLRVLRAWVAKKCAYTQAKIDGKVFFTVNGVRSPYSDAERADDVRELSTWKEAAEALGLKVAA
jgi:hypothetical protein